MKTIELECRECNGTGYYEHSFCFKPASECCGGCTKSWECEDCHGYGLIIFQPDNRLVDLLDYFLSNNTKQHEKIINLLTNKIYEN